jgi:hypothetical protein
MTIEIIVGLVITLLVMLFLHTLGDFALQSEAMARGKEKGGETKKNEMRFYWLSAHALIQGGLIFLVFGNPYLFIIEVITHFFIDLAKTHNRTNIHQDQGTHIALRFSYALIEVFV